jgi:uncharacterized protein (TIGR00369 family)
MHIERDRQLEVTWADPAILYGTHETMTSIELFRAVRDGKVPLEPAMRLLGARMAKVEEGEVTLTLDPAEHHYDQSGAVQPGIIAALTDTASGYAIHTKTALGVRCATLELQLSLLEPITIASGTISCIGRAVRIGARTATGDASVYDSTGRLCATMSTTFIVLPPAAAQEKPNRETP